MDARDQILKQIDERQEEWLRLLSELVRRPSENPPGDTRAAADCVVEHLKRQGYAPEVIEPRPGMVNVVAAADRGSGRSVIFSGDIVDGKVFGRGVSDMKAGTTASLIAFCLLAELRDAWKGRTTYAAVADEETMG